MEQKLGDFLTLKVVSKIIRPIHPVGETNTDNDRFENLKEMCLLIDSLISHIHDVYIEYKDRQEFSVKRLSEYAEQFLKEIIYIPR